MNTIQALQSYMLLLLPTLASNTGLAYKEYMAGERSHGSLNTIMARERNAQHLARATTLNDPLSTLQAFAPVMIDAETGLIDVPEAEAQAAFDALEALYAEKGFKRTILGFWSHPEARLESFPPLHIDTTSGLVSELAQYPVGTSFTHVQPKKKWDDFQESVEINGQQAVPSLEAFKAGLSRGLFELDSDSGNDPELHAYYTTYRLVSHQPTAARQ